ncbi:MAG: DNA polymerase III subunit epsilon, partial [Atopostipes sp.]|nr:DNA polymerase III subunit epsilon [Atopostipes sp.]
MLADQLYAIVDIEATGGSIGADERIIQIACVLMKNNKVIDRFNSLVNPGKRIPRKIQKLTNITNKEVQKAPYFEEIAPIIQRLLKGAIFVAHNVGFDYHFLSEQLTLHGFSGLAMAAIDTVELSQILYPSLDSFQLEEIAASLDYDLVDAHDALADAEATTYILEKLFERAQSLPLITLEKLVDLAECTTHETALFFINALKEAKKNPTDLAEDLVIVNDIAMQKPKTYEEGASLVEKPTYPESKEEKLNYLKENYQYRPVQAEMMDIIYQYFSKDMSLEKCAIEAPPGIGKTFAYLLATFFIAKEGEPIVISTYTTLLQDQLVDEAIPELEELLGRELNTVLVKSSRHYLSLSVFERWLKEMTGKDPEAYLSMRLLVWLTETKTGDLTEINAGSYLDLKFWQDIRARKNQYADDHWEDYDFYNRIKKANKKAEFIVTNHHFVVNDWQSDRAILKNLEHLVIDEAHHFPDIALEASTIDLKMNQLFTGLEKMGSFANNIGLFKFLNDL